MTEFLSVVVYIAMAVFAGANALYPISLKGRGLSVYEYGFISFGLGIGVVTLEMFLTFFFGAGFNVALIMAPWLVLFAVNLIIAVSRKGRKETFIRLPERKDHSPVFLRRILWGGIIFEVIYSIFRALIKPMESYDAVAIYAIKAKTFFLAGSIPGDYFGGLAQLLPHPDYPLNIPLFETFLYTGMGSLNDQLVKIIFPLFFISILGFVYCSVRRFATRTYALVFTFILSAIPQFNANAVNGYIDLVLAYYCVVSAVLLFEYMKDKKRYGFLVVSAVMAALAGWTKNEGLMYCVVFAFVITIDAALNMKKKALSGFAGPIAYVFIIGVALSPWIAVKRVYHLINTDTGAVLVGVSYFIKQLYKLGPIFYEFQKQAFGPKKWNIFWIVVLGAAVWKAKQLFSAANRNATICLLLIVAGYVYFYLIAALEINFFLSKTWGRFLVQFLPIVVYWLALILKEDIGI